MKQVVLALIVFTLDAACLHLAHARQVASGDDPVRTFPPIYISVGATYQRWTQHDVSVHELSFPITARLEPYPNLGVSVGLSQASAEGDGFEPVSGLTDVQLGFDYLLRFSRFQVRVNLGLNVPTGKSQLSDAAYETAYQLGQSQYDFRVPHFGQGVGVAPGIVGVMALAKGLTVGVGATYHVRGSFEPLADLLDAYDWGNELLLSVGGAWQISPTLSLSGDAFFARYDADKIGGSVVYEAGNRLMIQAQLQKNLGRHAFGLAFRYRDLGANRALVGGVLHAEAVQAFPGFSRIAGYYQVRLNAAMRTTIHAEGTRYEEAFGFQQLDVYSLGLAPDISLGLAVTVPVHVRYSFGDLEGLEAGLGVSVIL